MSTPIEALPTSDLQPIDEDVNLITNMLNNVNREQAAAEEHESPDDGEGQEQYDAAQEWEAKQAEAPAPSPSRTAGVLAIALRVFKEAKLPLLVALVYVLLGNPALDKLFISAIPRTAAPCGGVNIIGVALKSILLAIAVYLMSKL